VAFLNRLRAKLHPPSASVHSPVARGDDFLGGLVFRWIASEGHESDEGTRLTGTGVMFGADEEAIAWDDPRFEASGAMLFKVAGVSFRPEALAATSFDVGSRVQLVPEPANPIDQNAIAIYDSSGGTQIGYVPQALTHAVRRLLADEVTGILFYEWRLDEGTRCALRCALGPGRFINRLERYIGQHRSAPS
jgi:hypothetical protein